jgi:putative ABC transport system ATP-binding protein
MGDELLRVSGLAFERAATGGERGFRLEVDSLDLSAAQAVAVSGPSGCGKSTLIDLLALLRRPANVERFVFAGHDIAGLWAAEGANACAGVRARHIGVVLQTGGLLASLPVWENVTLPQALMGEADEAWCRELLRALDLVSLEHRLPVQLSIGQRQRVAIARALSHRPALVLADEPTAALGREHAHAALNLLLTLTREAGAALLIASHDTALLHAHHVPLLECVSVAGVTRIEAAPSCAPRDYVPAS